MTARKLKEKKEGEQRENGKKTKNRAHVLYIQRKHKQKPIENKLT